MEPLKPMKPMKPLPSGEAWWPRDLGKPASSSAQGRQRYTFFPGARRLLVEKDGRVTQYDSGDHKITGIAQRSGHDDPHGQPIAFAGENGPVRLDDLKRID